MEPSEARKDEARRLMPAKSKVNREAIKTLAVVHGIREAARLAGLPEATVQAWSARFKWLQPSPNNGKETEQPICNQSPSIALATTLSDHSKRSRIAFAKAATKASEHLAEQKPERILKSARQMKDVAGTAAMVHGWNEGKAGSGTLNLNILGGQSAIQVVQGPAVE